MDEFDGEGACAWERLLAHDESVLDAAWAKLMQQHWRATEVPLERRGTVLDVGMNSYVRRARLNTSKLGVIFNPGLGVCLVSKNFLAYRDAFVYGWGSHGASRSPTSSFRSPIRRRPSSSARPCRNSSAEQDKVRTAPVATTTAARRNHRACTRRVARETAMGTATGRATRSSGTS